MRLNRTTFILATIGAAAAGYVTVTAYRARGDGGRRAPALSGSEQHAAETFSTTRAAGTAAMRDPPKDWSSADQASDESFPASDPPPVNSRVD